MEKLSIAALILLSAHSIATAGTHPTPDVSINSLLKDTVIYNPNIAEDNKVSSSKSPEKHLQIASCAGNTSGPMPWCN